MNIAAAFIYGIVFAVMAANLIYCLVDMKRMRRESKRLDEIGEDIIKDIEVGKAYIETAEKLVEKYDAIEERLNKLEEKKATKTKKAKEE